MFNGHFFLLSIIGCYGDAYHRFIDQRDVAPTARQTIAHYDVFAD